MINIGKLKLAALVLGFAAFSATAAAMAEEVTVTVLGTSDLHGHILPVDYYNAAVDQGGLAQVATYVKQVRAGNPYTVLVDNGDNIEGGNSTLPVYYSQIQGTGLPNPMASAMNVMRYDSMVTGNHEYNFGTATLGRFSSAITFPVLGANVLKADGTPAYQPYVIKDFGPVQVGIVGVVTPWIPNWEKPENIAGLTYGDPVTAAKKWADEARAKGADIVIVTAHTGLEKAPTDTKDPSVWGKPELYVSTASDNESYGLRIANGVPGIDALLLGHDHKVVPGIGKVSGINDSDAVILTPGSWGDYVSRFDFTLEKVGESWRIKGKKASLVPMTKDVPVDPAVEAAAKYYSDQTLAYYAKPLTDSKESFTNGLKARTYDSAIFEIINKAQLKATGADISCTALFSNSSKLDKGVVSIQSIYGLYIYSNTLYKIEINGTTLRKALEQDAAYWNQWADQKTLTELVAPTARDYNWDVYSGIDYTVDLTKPVGQRITSLKFKGKDVTPDQEFTLAVNNYRGGGGGYDAFKGAKILWKSEAEVRDILLDYVKALGTLDPASMEDGSMRILPEAIRNLPVK